MLYSIEQMSEKIAEKTKDLPVFKLGPTTQKILKSNSATPNNVECVTVILHLVSAALVQRKKTKRKSFIADFINLDVTEWNYASTPVKLVSSPCSVVPSWLINTLYHAVKINRLVLTKWIRLTLRGLIAETVNGNELTLPGLGVFYAEPGKVPELTMQLNPETYE